MNYISIVNKITTHVEVDVYVPKESKFKVDGKLSMKRVFDDMGCDSGMLFYCKTDNTEFSFFTENIVLSHYYSINNSCKEITDTSNTYPLSDIQKSAIFETAGLKSKYALSIILLSDAFKTIDFVLTNDTGEIIVIEIRQSDFQSLLEQLQS